jgi:hypothetical protein
MAPSLPKHQESKTMKKALIAGLFAMAAGASGAAPHGFQLQIGSSELDPSIWEGPDFSFAPVIASDFTPSVDVLFSKYQVDGAGDLDFTGSIEPSGPSRISLYEVYRGTSEGIAHQSYYDRFPADTDWAAVAKDFQEHVGGESFVGSAHKNDNDAS